MTIHWRAVAVFAAIVILALFLTSCASTHSHETRLIPRVGSGCPLSYLDFGTGRGLECYCKMTVINESNQAKSYIYMIVDKEDCE